MQKRLKRNLKSPYCYGSHKWLKFQTELLKSSSHQDACATNYTKYTNQTIQDVTTGNDQIVINTTPMVTFIIDDIDEGDNYIDVKPEVTLMLAPD